MASPVFHGLAGAGIAYLLSGDAALPLGASLRKALPLLLAAAGLACLPDVDYLPGLWRGNLNTTHQQATHSVAWVGLASAGIWLTGRAWRPAWFGWKTAGLLLALIGSHLVIDLLTVDRLAPYGIPLWAPFSDRYVHSPVALLPNWDKTSLADMASWRNLRPLAVELSAGLAGLAGSVAAKRSWTRHRARL